MTDIAVPADLSTHRRAGPRATAGPRRAASSTRRAWLRYRLPTCLWGLAVGAIIALLAGGLVGAVLQPGPKFLGLSARMLWLGVFGGWRAWRGAHLLDDDSREGLMENLLLTPGGVTGVLRMECMLELLSLLVLLASSLVALASVSSSHIGGVLSAVVPILSAACFAYAMWAAAVAVEARLFEPFVTVILVGLLLPVVATCERLLLPWLGGFWFDLSLMTAAVALTMSALSWLRMTLDSIRWRLRVL